MWPFGSKDKPEDNKVDTDKVTPSSSKDSPPKLKSNNLDPRSTLGSASSLQVQGVQSQLGPPATPVPKAPSVTFDSSSVEAIKGSFVRMANAFDELKRLNEEHKRIQ